MGQVSVNGGPVTGLDYLPYAFSYYWAMSPDGERLAHTTGGDRNGPLRVLVRETQGTSEGKILNIRPAWFLKWTPDGKSLVYREGQQGENLATKVFQIDPDGGEPRLWLSTEPDNILDLTFSRDATRFAAVRLKVLTDAVILTRR